MKIQEADRITPPSGEPRSAVRVPELVGRSSHEARILIREAGLTLSVVRLMDTSHAVAGIVLDQHPRSSRKVLSGVPVDLTVASGQYR